ncbi:MAG: phosphopantetheine-binding protein [Mycobacteriales bacterium]
MDDLLTVVRDELGIEVSDADAGRDLDELPGWDSMHLLWLLTLLERDTGRQLSLPDLLHARSLEQIYTVAVGT